VRPAAPSGGQPHAARVLTPQPRSCCAPGRPGPPDTFPQPKYGDKRDGKSDSRRRRALSPPPEIPELDIRLPVRKIPRKLLTRVTGTGRPVGGRGGAGARNAGLTAARA